MNVGLLYTPVSIYQMTRGALVLFVGVLSGTLNRCSNQPLTQTLTQLYSFAAAFGFTSSALAFGSPKTADVVIL
jgi:hypothetical protein